MSRHEIQKVQIVADGTTDPPASAMTVNDFLTADASTPYRQCPEDYRYIFREPSSLDAVIKACSEPGSEALKSLRHLRLCILAPMAKVKLKRAEKDGVTDEENAPRMFALHAEWRAAIRDLPAENSLQTVQFDMVCGEHRLNPMHHGRILQHISTFVNLRSKRLIQCYASRSDPSWFRKELNKHIVGCPTDPEQIDYSDDAEDEPPPPKRSSGGDVTPDTYFKDRHAFYVKEIPVEDKEALLNWVLDVNATYENLPRHLLKYETEVSSDSDDESKADASRREGP